ncbi:AfsA-related hotdog domain-containing protein [Streptomyces sp. NPDC050560]|uniref:AfsA-related hotdog domain-containing protein n=1 Tax=Streptomyces sp. NPDC050560 TaxID=3365630 RepID=UPI0037A9C799
MDTTSSSTAVPSLPFPLPHHLVHRPETPEAYLSHSTAPVRQHFVFSAELPTEHPLFGDASPAFHDLLFASEALRHVGLFAARHYFRVPEDRHPVFATSRLEITEPGPWRRTERPAHIALHLDITPKDVVNGIPRGLDCAAGISIDSAPCGRADARMTFLMPGVYRAHRAHGRRESFRSEALGATAELAHLRALCELESDEAAADRAPAPESGAGGPGPEGVGRRSRQNVLVGSPLDIGTDGLLFPVDTGAALAVLPAGPADQVPAALFFEASRQTSLLAADLLHGFAPAHSLLVRWQAAFRGFAEPDLPLYWSVRTAGAGATRDAAGRPVAELALSVTQGGRTVADATAAVLQDC